MTADECADRCEQDSDFQSEFKASAENNKRKPHDRGFVPEDMKERVVFEMYDYRDFLKLTEQEVKKLCGATPKKLKLQPVDGFDETGEPEQTYLLIDDIQGPRTAGYRRSRIKSGRCFSRDLHHFSQAQHTVERQGEFVKRALVDNALAAVRIPPSGKRKSAEAPMEWLTRVPKLSKTPHFKGEDGDHDATGAEDESQEPGGAPAAPRNAGAGAARAGSPTPEAKQTLSPSFKGTMTSASSRQSFPMIPRQAFRPPPAFGARPAPKLTAEALMEHDAGSADDDASAADAPATARPSPQRSACSDAGLDGRSLVDDSVAGFDKCPRDIRQKCVYWREMTDCSRALEDAPLGKEYNQATKLRDKIRSLKAFATDYKMLNAHIELFDVAKTTSVANVVHLSDEDLEENLGKLKRARVQFPVQLQQVLLTRHMARSCSHLLDFTTEKQTLELYSFVKPYHVVPDGAFDPLAPEMSALSGGPATRMGVFKDIFVRQILLDMIDRGAPASQKVLKMSQWLLPVLKADIKRSIVPDEFTNDFFALITGMKVVSCLLDHDASVNMDDGLETLTELEELSSGKPDADDIAQMLQSALVNSTLYKQEIVEFKTCHSSCAKYAGDVNACIADLDLHATKSMDECIKHFDATEEVLSRFFDEYPKWQVCFRKDALNKMGTAAVEFLTRLFLHYEAKRESSDSHDLEVNSVSGGLLSLVSKASRAYPLRDDLATMAAKLGDWQKSDSANMLKNNINSMVAKILQGAVDVEICSQIRQACEGGVAISVDPLLASDLDKCFSKVGLHLAGLIAHEPGSVLLPEGMQLLGALLPWIDAKQQSRAKGLQSMLNYAQKMAKHEHLLKDLGKDDGERSRHDKANEFTKALIGHADGFEKAQQQYLEGANAETMHENLQQLLGIYSSGLDLAKRVASAMVEAVQKVLKDALDVLKKTAGGAQEQKAWSQELNENAKLEQVLIHAQKTLLAFPIKENKSKMNEVDKARWSLLPLLCCSSHRWLVYARNCQMLTKVGPRGAQTVAQACC